MFNCIKIYYLTISNPENHNCLHSCRIDIVMNTLILSSILILKVQAQLFPQQSFQINPFSNFGAQQVSDYSQNGAETRGKKSIQIKTLSGKK